ncbi:MAG TPA: type I-E CRISPR-associated protein Cse2/CasB [Chloroflexota bacterium]|nr:type I-E CRISPR-associated protein Cse2/CasB [Chloroflexota bacterium]
MSQPTPAERRFVDHLVALTDPRRQDGRGALAALRRGLGKPPGTVAEMFPVVGPFDPGGTGWDSDRYYLVASLFGSHPDNWDYRGGDDRSSNLGASLRLANRESGGVQAALTALLNSGRDELPDRLRHCIALCGAARPPAAVDWAQLLHDLRWWDSARRDTQRRWATSFWQPRREGENEE